MIPGSGRTPGEGNGNLLHYSSLGNPMDRGAWWATVHGVAKSRTRPSNETTTTNNGDNHLCKLSPAAAAAKSLQSCPTLCDPIDRQPSRFRRPWDSPGKNTGVGCHFLLQCMKVKSESEVAQSCPTLRDPMDCSLPGSSIHGIFQARVQFLPPQLG